MKKVTRGAAPACLGTFHPDRDRWDDVSFEQKVEIWVGIHAMQGERCAYCECEIQAGGRHIEHFIQRREVRAETFNWANLFGSCCIKDTCGDLKDKVGTYNRSDVLKPDIDEPDDFFLFVSDGTIIPLHSLVGRQKLRADTTLDVLGLHHKNGQLRHMRQQAVLGYIQMAEEFAEFAAADPENELGWREELEKELSTVATLPFSTAIRHMFRSYVDC